MIIRLLLAEMHSISSIIKGQRSICIPLKTIYKYMLPKASLISIRISVQECGHFPANDTLQGNCCLQKTSTEKIPGYNSALFSWWGIAFNPQSEDKGIVQPQDILDGPTSYLNFFATINAINLHKLPILRTRNLLCY